MALIRVVKPLGTEVLLVLDSMFANFRIGYEADNRNYELAACVNTESNQSMTAVTQEATSPKKSSGPLGAEPLVPARKILVIQSDS